MQLNLTAHVDNPTWREHAECQGLDPNVFHPERGANTSGPKAVCGPCSVKDECLSFALVNFEKHGIWGGLSERERRVIRGQLTRAGILQPPIRDIEHGTDAGYHAHRRRHERPCDDCQAAHARKKDHYVDLRETA